MDNINTKTKLKTHSSLLTADFILNVKVTHKINSNCTYVAVHIRVILKEKKKGKRKTIINKKPNMNLKFVQISKTTKIKQKGGTRTSKVQKGQLTANLRSKQDFPTEESPISRSLNRQSLKSTKTKHSHLHKQFMPMKVMKNPTK